MKLFVQKQNPQALLTFQEAATQMKVHYHALVSRVRNGSLRAYRRKGKTYITAEDIANWQPLWDRGHDLVVREAHAAGESDVAIGAMLGLSRERIRQIRNALGLAKNPLKPRLPKHFAPQSP